MRRGERDYYKEVEEAIASTKLLLRLEALERVLEAAKWHDKTHYGQSCSCTVCEDMREAIRDAEGT